jgi:uncharacterized tellurite resistance protein B-like protein
MMSDKTLIMALARVIIAAAWADGEITQDEISSLKDLLFRLPQAGQSPGIQLTGREWARLEMYMATPVTDAERERLVVELQEELHTEAQRQLALDALRSLVEADGVVTEEEQALLAEIGTALQDMEVGVLGALQRLVGGSLAKRRQAVANAPNREAYFEDYLRNKVYFALRQRLSDAGVTLDLSEEELRTLGLAGGLMAKVARVDGEVTDEEVAALVAAVQNYWPLDDKEAAFVAEVALSAVDQGYDTLRMMRELADSTSIETRKRFLAALFAVAAADGEISIDEHEEIRFIARGINLVHSDFIDAKLEVLGI